MIRRARSLAAHLIDAVVAPLGWDVLVCRTSDLPGIDWFTVRRRPAGLPRARIPGPVRAARAAHRRLS